MKTLFLRSGMVIMCLVVSLFAPNPGQALFFNFEDDAQLKEWNILSGTWQIEKDKISNSNVVSGEGGDDLILSIGDESWTDYTIELEACGLTDDIGIGFRVQDASNYYAFLLAPNLNLSEWFLKKGGAFDENLGNKGDSLGVRTNEWHKYKLVVEKMQARVFVDGKEPFDPVEIMSGDEKRGVLLRQWADHGHYDNVLITGPGIPRSPGEMAVKPGGKLASAWGHIKARY